MSVLYHYFNLYAYIPLMPSCVCVFCLFVLFVLFVCFVCICLFGVGFFWGGLLVFLFVIIF